MRRKGFAAASVVVAVVLIIFFYFFWGSSVPDGQQPLVRLNGANVSTLKDAFNSSSGDVRLVVMLSPT